MSAHGRLETRLLRSHLAVAGIGLLVVALLLLASLRLRDRTVRLATDHGPAVADVAVALDGLHRASAGLYGWLVVGDARFRQDVDLAWRNDLRPALTRVSARREIRRDPESFVEFDELTGLLDDLHTWERWVADVAWTPGNEPASRHLDTTARPLAARVRAGADALEAMERWRPLGGGAPRAHVISRAHALGAAAGGVIDPLDRLARGTPARPSELAARLDALAAARAALAALLPALDAEARARLVALDAEAGALERAAVAVAAKAEAEPNLARRLLQVEVMPRARRATNLLTTLSVAEGVAMQAEAARAAWDADGAVTLGLLLLSSMALVAVGLSRRSAERITEPIARLSRATARIAAGAPREPIRVRGDDEIAALARSFVRMQDALEERRMALDNGRILLRGRNRRLATEVAERRRAEQQLARRSGELVRANRALALANADLAERNADLDAFTHIASHDLKEPARKLVAFGKLLRMDFGADLPERAGLNLQHLTDAADHMQTLVDDLLVLSRAGRAAMVTTEVELDGCLDRALDRLEVQITETGAEIEREGLPAVRGDRTLLTQLFQNLIANAIKFHAPGERPHVTVTCESIDGRCVIGVKDRGIGLKPEYAEQVFEPFRRLHGRDAYEGNGIGLAIAEKAVSRHGGKIWVESEVGRGAHFRFTIGTHERSGEGREAA